MFLCLSPQQRAGQPANGSATPTPQPCLGGEKPFSGQLDLQVASWGSQVIPEITLPLWSTSTMHLTRQPRNQGTATTFAINDKHKNLSR